MKKLSNGFTIIELLVVIAIIGILATIGIVSYSKIQSGARDSQRSSKAAVITEALEKYFDQNGEYPDCSKMTQPADTVSTDTLKGIDPSALTTPSGNSIVCTDPTTDAFGYVVVGDGTSYTLKYKEDSSGQIKTIASRRASRSP